ncbi:Cytochrome P450 CYP2 subfamily [Handroanthus impetiginosus]|uniref:Cytochrome P450 CYP2 subfamily n=1 Tax=Handroanthus impetiginosus TaxID=429701 RepID=A0A2G9H203_9LAMI|nr:Cytochrome P450 CYP2 subfamily [Handroanthus impetiginosus]
MILFLLLVTLPIVSLYILLKNRAAKALTPPGPPGLPLIGHLHQLSTSTNLHEFLWQLSKKYGPIMYLKLGSVPLVVISSAKLAKEVLKTHDNVFCSRPKFVGQQKLSYDGLDIAFSPYSDYWRELRKITTLHLFSQKKVQSFSPIREDEISRLVAKISSFASTSQVLNLNETMTSFTSTLICRVAFGERYDEEGSKRRRFDELLREAQAMMASFFISDYFPGFSWVDKLSGLMIQLEKTFKRLDEFYQELIDEHLDFDRRNTAENDDDGDILDVLIRLKEGRSCSIDLNWENIKGLLMDIFIGGTETIAAAVIWTMTILVTRPNMMEKVQAQIRELVGRKGKLNEDDLQKLSYLRAVINEALRLYPPLPLLLPRTATEKCMVEGYEVLPKTLVYYWENPDEFLPERFLHENIDVRGQEFGMIPFGSGRRVCPGIFMGLATVGVTIANLLYNFDWELPHGMTPQEIDMDVLPGLAAHKKNALYLIPRKYI